MSTSEMTLEPRKITVTHGDISLLQLPDGAIVNPSNTGLILNSGVGEQLSRRAGPLFQQKLHILRSRMRNNILDMGRVVETDAGQINAKFIFHASILGREPTTVDIITTALLNIFDLAERLGVTALAFPALGVGAPKLPLNDFLELFWKLANEELPRSECVESVILCLFNEDEFNITCSYIQEHEDLIEDDVEVEIVRGSLWQNFS